MYIPIEIQETYNSKSYIMNAGLVKGRNYLIRNGWEYCTNNSFLTNGFNTGHYNRFMKCWKFDNDILNQRDVNLTEHNSTMQHLGAK